MSHFRPIAQDTAMNFVISMIPITNTELAVLSHGGNPTFCDGNRVGDSNWMADAMAQRAFAGQPLVEHSYASNTMPAICAALGLSITDGLLANRAICVSAHEMAAACSRYQMARMQSDSERVYSTFFMDQCAHTVCAALVHWCPHVYITIDLIEG